MSDQTESNPIDLEVQSEGEILIDDSLEAMDDEVGSDGDEIDENLEFVEHDQLLSIVESILFTTDKPQSVSAMKQAFRGTQVKAKMIRKALEELKIDYAGGRRGITLEEIGGGYQLRSKYDNMDFLRRMIKGRSFKLSGPALETLAIIAYKQPCVKFNVDEIRGVESGHLVRSLMERGLIKFAGKSELPGKPMLYETTRKFLEIFGLRNIHELPTISEIDELIPEGIEEVQEDKESLDDITENMSQDAGTTYSEGEEELESITSQLVDIDTSSEFFEKEKQRMRDKRDAERAKDINDAILVGEEVSKRDKKWLEKHDKKIAEREMVAKAEAERALNNEVGGEEQPEQEMAAVENLRDSELTEAEIQDNRSPDEIIAEIEAESHKTSGEIVTEVNAQEDKASIDYVTENMSRDTGATYSEVEDKGSSKSDPDVAALLASDDEEDSVERIAIGHVNFNKLEEDLKIFDEPAETIDRHLADDENEKN